MRVASLRMGLRSHTHLGEVERGKRRPFPESRWSCLIAAIPGITHEGLAAALSETKPVELKLGGAPPDYQRLARALAARIEHRDIPPRDMRKLLSLLKAEAA